MIVWMDAQLSPRLARWIEETFGIESLHIRDLGLRNVQDPEIFQKARDARAIVISSESKMIMPSRLLAVNFSLACVILFSVVVSISSPTRAQSGGPGTIILKFTGLRSEKGQVRIAVFNSSETWLGEHPAYLSTINVDSQTVTKNCSAGARAARRWSGAASKLRA